MKLKSIKNRSIVTLFGCLASFLILGAGPSSCSREVSFVTQNLYLGADVTRILRGVQPIELLQTIVETRFIERAEVLANIIAREKPDILGLQEVAKYRMQIPSDFTENPIANAEDIIERDFSGNPFAGDFLDTLLVALKTRGLNYKIGLSISGTDIEIPVFLSSGDLADIRLTINDVVLVKESISLEDSFHKHYENQFSHSLEGITVEFTRSYGMLALKKKFGQPFYVLHTHLEDISEAIRIEQATELLDFIDTLNSSTPVILLGDFNSAALNTGTDASLVYEMILARGFSDAVLGLHPEDRSSTCCHREDLRDTEEEPGFLSIGRIDHIFYRSTHSSVHPKEARILGLGEKSVSGLWPSDHLAVFVEFGLSRR